MLKCFLLLTSMLVSQQVFANPYLEKSFTFSYDKYEPSKFSGEVAVTNWHSPEGISRFNKSQYKGDFFRLAHHFKPQMHQATCGIASSNIIMRALYEQSGKKFPITSSMPINIGEKVYGLDYRDLNEENFFNDQTDKIMPRLAIKRLIQKNDGQFGGGIDMEDIAKMLKVKNVKVKVVNITQPADKGLDEFRATLKTILNDDKQFMVANYSHDYKSNMGGHYSPIVAYDSDSDSVLILDVAAHKMPWIWVNLTDFYLSMYTKNYAGNAYRGYMIFSGFIKN